MTFSKSCVAFPSLTPLLLVRNACTKYSPNHSNRIIPCLVTHLTRRGRGLAPRSSALQLSQHSLGPSLPPLGIHTLLAQVIFILFSVI